MLLLQDYGGGNPANDEAFGRPDGLGTFLGVFVPCTCTIFGVVVFLRLGFVVGQAGVWCSLAVVFSSFCLCLVTMLSLCSLIGDAADDAARDASAAASAAAVGGSCSSNGVEGGGIPEAESSNVGGSSSRSNLDPGVYCALRRGVGPDLGAALGLAFYLAFTVDAAFYITGFATMLSDALPELASHVNVNLGRDRLVRRRVLCLLPCLAHGSAPASGSILALVRILLSRQRPECPT